MAPCPHSTVADPLCPTPAAVALPRRCLRAAVDNPWRRLSFLFDGIDAAGSRDRSCARQRSTRSRASTGTVAALASLSTYASPLEDPPAQSRPAAALKHSPHASFSASEEAKPFTISSWRAKHEKGQKITMVTAYDYPSAKLSDAAGVDCILVGDSLGMVVLGYDSTVPVTLDEIIHHAKAVARGAKKAFLVGDLPFGSYLTPEDALRSSARLIKEGKMHAVKLEGGKRMVEQVRAVVNAGIPVMGHIGLTPQTASSLGGFKVQGKSSDAALRLLEDAISLQEAGCFAIVLECVPSKLAAFISASLNVPTVGIGAGVDTAGQVQVFHDLLGLYDKLQPKFSKRYVNAAAHIQEALRDYVLEVTKAKFPAPEHSFSLKQEEFDGFLSLAQALHPDAFQRYLHFAAEKSVEVAAASALRRSGSSSVSAGVGVPHRADADLPQRSLLQSSARSFHHTSRSTGWPWAWARLPRPSHTLLPAPYTFSPPQRALSLQAPRANGPQVVERVVVCVGGGALGSLLAGRLSQVPETCVWVLSNWREHVEMIRSSGLQVSSLHGSHVAPKVCATSDIQQVLDFVADRRPAQMLICICVKGVPEEVQQAALRADAILQGIRGSVPQYAVLTLQNGFGNRERISRLLGPYVTVYEGTTLNAATVEAGTVSENALGETFLVDADMPAACASLPISAVAELLRSCGLPCRVVPAAQGETIMWRKLAVNATINPLTALLSTPNGFLATDPHCLELLALMSQEIAQVAEVLERHHRIHRGDDAFPSDVFAYVKRAAELTGSNKSSMLTDVQRHRPTEIESLTGCVVAEAQRLGVPVPTCRTVLLLLRALQNRDAATAVRA